MKQKNNYFIKVWAVALMLVGFAFNASAVVVKPVVSNDTIITIADTYLRSSSDGNDKYHTGEQLQIQNFGTNYTDAALWERTVQFMALVKFDISGYTDTVVGATYSAAFSKINIASGFDVFKLDEDWTPTDITWNTAPQSFRDIPSYNASHIDADSAMAIATANNYDAYLGRWALNTAWDDGSYIDYDITDCLNSAILAGETTLTLAFTMAQLFDEANTANKYNRMYSLEYTANTPPCLVIENPVAPAPYFNNFSDDSQSDWLNASGEYANVKNGRIEDGLVFGTYKYQLYTYAPADETPWIYTTAYPIFAFKLYMKDSVGNFCSAFPQDDAAAIKFDNKNKNPQTTYSADTVNYWDFTSGRLGTSTPDEGANTSIFMKLPSGTTSPDSSVVLDWIGTFASTTELENFIAIADDATLSEINLDGSLLIDFNTDTYSYDNVAVITVPAITAAFTSMSAYASYEVTNATAVPGTTIIVATAADGSTKATYTLNLVQDGATATQELEKREDVIVISGVGHIKLQNLVANDVVAFYDLQGRAVAQTQVSDSELIMNLTSGVYIVKVNNQFTAKTIVY